eukprot:8830095-Pyramimonas_sp.AAC.1
MTTATTATRRTTATTATRRTTATTARATATTATAARAGPAGATHPPGQGPCRARVRAGPGGPQGGGPALRRLIQEDPGGGVDRGRRRLAGDVGG